MSTGAVESAPIDAVKNHPELMESDLFTEYITRVRNNRDMHVLFTGEGETGVGKTTAATSLCILCDFNGFTAEKAKYSVPDYNVSYFEADPGSWLLADDVQKWMDSRESMKKEQRNTLQDIQANRVRQVMVAWTAPSKNWLDKRLGGDVVDFWIQCLEGEDGEPAGKARVYRAKHEEHYDNDLTEKTETLSWPILDDNRIFQEIEEKKLRWLEGEMERRYISMEEFEDAKKNFYEKFTKKTRFEALRGFHHLLEEKDLLGRGGEITQAELGAALGRENTELELKQSMVSKIVEADSFEEIYHS